MRRDKVFKNRRALKKRSYKNKVRFSGCSTEDKTIEYMEELGRLGHWVHQTKDNNVSLSKSAMDIFRCDNQVETLDYSDSMLSKFDALSKQKIQKMFEDVQTSGKSSIEEVAKLEEDGSISQLRMIQGMSDSGTLIGVVQDMTPWYDREKKVKDQLKFTQDIIDVMPMPVFMKNLHGEYRHCNQAFLDLFGFRRVDVLGKTSHDLANPLHVEELLRIDDEVIRSGGVIQSETVITQNNKEPRDCIITKTILRDTSQKVIGIVGTIRDITEDKKKGNHIHKLMTLKDAMMEITHAIMDNRSETDLYHLILEKGLGAIHRANHGTVLIRCADGLFRPVAWRGYEDDKIKGFELELEKSFVWRATDGPMKKSVRINDLSVFLTEDIPELAESNSGMHIHASLCSPIVVEGEIIGLMNLDSTVKDAFDQSDLKLSEYMREQLEIALTRRKLYDKVVFLSRHDELTGLYNRRYFEELAESTLKRSQRYNERFCLAVFDLNGLKLINDTYGHQLGDEVLQQFANTLRASFRETDILGRFGGDEFIGIFHESDHIFLHKRLEAVLESLDMNPIEHEGYNIVGSFSYGIATYPLDGDTYNRLVSVADKSMYEYKDNWRKND